MYSAHIHIYSGMNRQLKHFNQQCGFYLEIDDSRG